MKKNQFCLYFKSRNYDNDNVEVTITAKSRFCFITRTLVDLTPSNLKILLQIDWQV